MIFDDKTKKGVQTPILKSINEQPPSHPYLEFVDNVAYLEGGPQLEPEVLHQHVSVEQQQRLAVNLVAPEGLHVVGETGVQQGDLGQGQCQGCQV